MYLSQYIIETKSDYYRLLQTVRDTNQWQDWLVYILNGVAITAQRTIRMVKNIKYLMQEYKLKIRKEFNFYSQDLLNNLFCHPYTNVKCATK